MIEEQARHRCTGDYGTALFVVEHRHAFTSPGGAGPRQHRGATWATLLNGELVRYIDVRASGIIAMGELLVHDRRRCNCAPGAVIATRDRGRESMARQA